jgi:outer membrane scaffolding protein for murein synthesis (MipA/OmpV family)
MDLHLGGGFIYADDGYTDHYFGVNASNVGTSGLPFFEADGGMQEYYLSLGSAIYLSRNGYWVPVSASPA